MRNLILVCGLVLMSAVLALGRTKTTEPTIDSGSINGNKYSNQFLGITWEFPLDWIVQNSAKSTLGADHHTLLSLQPSGTQSTELVEINYINGSDVNNSIPLMVSKGWTSIGKQRYYTLGGGIPVQRNDFKSTDGSVHYAVVLTGIRRNFTLNFVLLANLPERFDELAEQLSCLQVQPDWGTPEEPPAPRAVGSRPKQVQISSDENRKFVEHTVPPVYPDIARKARIQGSVVMIAHVTKEGKLKNIYVISGHPTLVPFALDAVSQWKYRPYIQDGEPVEMETAIKVVFSLSGEPYF